MNQRKFLLFVSMLTLALVAWACTPATEPPPPPPPPTTAPAQEAAAPTEAVPAQEAAAPAEAAAPTEAPAEAAASGFTPSNVECIAPSGPGGGWDWTCRSAGNVLSAIGLVEGTVKVTNMAGGGGGVAYANVVTQRNDDDNLIVAASPATTLRLAQGQFGEFTEDEVRWIGSVGADFAVISVAKDSPYQTLADLMAALKEDPNAVNFGGGSAIGGQDHMKVMVLAQAAGIDPLTLKYTPFDGGGEAMTAMLGGFVDVFPGDVSETLGQLEAGEIRVLATLTSDRMGGLLEGVPTAKEQGYDTEWIVFRGFYGPGGMSDDAYNFWVSALGKMADSPEWETQLNQGGLEKIVRLGPDFDAFVRNQIANFRKLSVDLGLIEGAEAAPASSFTPSNVECIAPSGPGGGWDWTCRSAGKVLSDIGLVEGTVKVTNMAGGGGGVAFANVVTQRNDDNNLIVAASPATTLRLAQGQFGDFTEDDVRWIGSVGADFAVISVAKDSPYQTLNDLMAALKEDPGSINFGGGSAIGGQDHMKVMVLAQAAGIDPLTLKYTPFDGGGEAMTAMLGGFVDVFPGDVSETLGQLEAGEIRVLGTLTSDRMGGLLEGVPTAKEQGYDAEWVVFRGFYGPGGMSDDAYNFWISALGEMADSPEWEEQLKQGGVEKIVRLGPEYDAFVKNQIANFRQLSKDLGLIE
jgi:putative tricarboxylic transport membrane protein